MVFHHRDFLLQLHRDERERGWGCCAVSVNYAPVRTEEEEKPKGLRPGTLRIAIGLGLTVVADDIADSANNYTRFICISRKLEIYPQARKISLMLNLAHEPGALNGIVSRLAMAGVNLLKLESRPLPGREFEFRFFFDMTASVADPDTLRLLDGSGRSVREEGPMDKEPILREEEPGLWSVTHGTGPDLTLRWTYFYDLATGQVSEAFYGVLDEQDRMLIRAEQTGLQVRGLFFSEPDWLLTDFSQPLAETAATPFRSAAFAEDGKSLRVTYLSGEDFHEVTETIPLPERDG